MDVTGDIHFVCFDSSGHLFMDPLLIRRDEVYVKGAYEKISLTVEGFPHFLICLQSRSLPSGTHMQKKNCQALKLYFLQNLKHCGFRYILYYSTIL